MRQASEDLGYRRAEHFADADLFGAPLQDDGRVAKQAHAGDENGDDGRQRNGAANLLLVLVLTSKSPVEELVLKRLFGCHLCPELLQAGEGVVAPVQPH